MKKQAFNPMLPLDTYIPDVEPHMFGDRVYLYGSHGFDGPISVAVCDTPAGRYEYYGDVKYPDGRPLSRFIPFDPAVINDNGHIYLTYGWGLGMDTHSWMNRLAIPAVMSKIFNKSIEEIKRDDP